MLNQVSFKKVLILFFFIFSLLAIYFYNLSDLKNLKFNWDEADYVKVSSKGLIENYTDNESLTIKQFIYIGKKKFFNEKFDSYIKTFINEEDDNFNLRHFHPTLPVYYWSLFISDQNSNDVNNQNLRISLLILYIIFIFYFIFIIYRLIPNNFSKIFISLIVLTTFLTNKYVISGFINLQFHIFYSLILIYHINSLINLYLKKINLFLVFNFIFSTSLIILTLHTSLISIFASFVSLIYLNKIYHHKITIFKFAKYLTCSIVIAILLFPPILTKGYYVKIFLTYVYKIILLRSAEFSTYGSLFDKWYNYFIHNNYIFLIPLFCIFLMQFNVKKENQYLYVFLIHSFIYSSLITPFFVSFTYILPVLMCIIVFVINFVSLNNNLNKKIEKFLIIIIAFVIIFVNLNTLKLDHYKTFVKDYNNRLTSIEDLITSNQNKQFLIDGAHIFKFYTFNQNIDKLAILSRSSPDFFIRKEYNYVSIKNEIINNFYDFIIIQKNRNYTDKQLLFLLSNNYVSIQNDFYNVYKLSKSD